MGLQTSTLQFFQDLAKHNDREWFQENKGRYEEAKKDQEQFAHALLAKMAEHDDIERHKIFRIYRDVRFSKDKTPYNPSFRFSMKRRKPYLRGGYYLNIGPVDTFIGGGFWNPNKEDLLLMRQVFREEGDKLEAIISTPVFKENFGELQGDKVKTAPKGFARDEKYIDFIRHKNLFASKTYPSAMMTKKDTVDRLSEDYKKMRPWFDYMSDVLGHDLNGIPLY